VIFPSLFQLFIGFISHHLFCFRYEGSIREAKRHGLGVMLYADGCVFGGIWQGDLKADGVFIDGSNNWTCGTPRLFPALNICNSLASPLSRIEYM
jgi:hypothetical protein